MFSLPAIAAANPPGGRPGGADLVFFGLLLGFGVELPVVPLHRGTRDTVNVSLGLIGWP
jgi:NADH:ubiquinone oxidoreductase subunit 4 (subunit M)